MGRGTIAGCLKADVLREGSSKAVGRENEKGSENGMCLRAGGNSLFSALEGGKFYLTTEEGVRVFDGSPRKE